MKVKLESRICHDFDKLRDTLSAWSCRLSNERAAIIEERIRLVLKPKPKWMPEKTYRWLICLLINMEVHK